MSDLSFLYPFAVKSAPERRKENMRKIVVMALTLGLLLASFYYKPVPVARANGCISPPSGMISWWAGDGAAND